MQGVTRGCWCVRDPAGKDGEGLACWEQSFQGREEIDPKLDRGLLISPSWASPHLPYVPCIPLCLRSSCWREGV